MEKILTEKKSQVPHALVAHLIHTADFRRVSATKLRKAVLQCADLPSVKTTQQAVAVVEHLCGRGCVVPGVRLNERGQAELLRRGALGARHHNMFYTSDLLKLCGSACRSTHCFATASAVALQDGLPRARLHVRPPAQRPKVAARKGKGALNASAPKRRKQKTAGKKTDMTVGKDRHDSSVCGDKRGRVAHADVARRGPNTAKTAAPKRSRTAAKLA